MANYVRLRNDRATQGGETMILVCCGFDHYIIPQMEVIAICVKHWREASQICGDLSSLR